MIAPPNSVAERVIPLQINTRYVGDVAVQGKQDSTYVYATGSPVSSGLQDGLYIGKVALTKSDFDQEMPDFFEERGDPNAEQHIIESIIQNYPLWFKTPKETREWEINYSDKWQITVSYLHFADLEQVKEEVFEWMREEGVDPETHEFIWEEVGEQ